MRPLYRLSVLVFLLMLLITVQPTLAHGYIVRAIPEDRSTLEHPPARLQYWFSEALEPRFSTITLRDQTGKALAEGQVAPALTQWNFKTIYEALVTPITYAVVDFFKRKEGIDVYDDDISNSPLKFSDS